MTTKSYSLGEVSTIIKDQCVETIVALSLTLLYPSDSPMPDLIRQDRIREMELKHAQLGEYR